MLLPTTESIHDDVLIGSFPLFIVLLSRMRSGVWGVSLACESFSFIFPFFTFVTKNHHRHRLGSSSQGLKTTPEFIKLFPFSLIELVSCSPLFCCIVLTTQHPCDGLATFTTPYSFAAFILDPLLLMGVLSFFFSFPSVNWIGGGYLVGRLVGWFGGVSLLRVSFSGIWIGIGIGYSVGLSFLSGLHSMMTGDGWVGCG